MEHNLPIDIHAVKLVDWLISRRHAKKNWPEAVQVVREKINNAIQDMPEHPEITRLLSGAYINYFHCLQIINILKETEKESKNIFGWYTSKRMKDWQEIVKLYEVDNLYLVEAAQFLIRNVAYEIPSLKRQISKCRSIQEESDKKEEEFRKNSIIAKERFYSSCKQIGLIGDNVRKELLGLVNELPEEFRKIAEKSRALEDPRNFYKEFVAFVSSTKQQPNLPLLKFLIEHGDVTVYEWKYGEAPITIEKEEIDYADIEQKDNEENGFVVVDNPVDFENVDSIDFGDENLTTGDIDWGTLDTPSVDENVAQIDWDVTEMGSEDIDSSQIVVESSGVEGGIAKGYDALTILSNESTRNQFINELMELEGFLSQRLVELVGEDSVLSMSQFSSAPKSVQYQNKELLDSHLDIVKDIIEDISSTKMQHLYLISASSRYVDRLADSLKSKLRESERLLSQISKVTVKRNEAILEQQKLSAQLQLIIGRTKELQKDIEEEISKKYQNRTVNLMGGIQNI